MKNFRLFLSFLIFAGVLSFFSLFKIQVAIAATEKSASQLNLKGYWAFNEGTGTQVGDMSGNGNTATTTGSPTWVSGKMQKGMNFDSVDDCARIQTTSNLEAGTNFSVSAWFTNADTGTTERYITGKYGSSGNQAWLLGKSISSTGDFGFQVRTGAGVNATAAISSNQYNDGKWHYAVGVKSGTSLTLYVDGVSVGSGSNGSITSTSSTGDMEIGAIVGCSNL